MSTGQAKKGNLAEGGWLNHQPADPEILKKQVRKFNNIERTFKKPVSLNWGKKNGSK
jgi:hypothetical protein